MKRLALIILFWGFLKVGYAQQTGIGTTTPDPSSILDVTAADKGILIPRVALDGITDETTIANGNVESLLVFNTADTADVTPGYYYWYDGNWRRVVSAENVTGVPDNIVVFDPLNSSFTYVDENGAIQSIDLEEQVKQHETVTFLEDNGNGFISYINEARDTVTLDLSAIANNTSFIPRTSVYAQSETEQVFGSGAQYNNGTRFEVTFENGDIDIQNQGMTLLNQSFWQVQDAGKYDFLLTVNFSLANASGYDSALAPNLNVEYSTDNGSSWIVGAGSRNLCWGQPMVYTFNVSGLIDLPAGALVRFTISSGGGTAPPNSSRITTLGPGNGRVYTKSLRVLRLE